jgi:hypothetical protein
MKGEKMLVFKNLFCPLFLLENQVLLTGEGITGQVGKKTAQG